ENVELAVADHAGLSGGYLQLIENLQEHFRVRLSSSFVSAAGDIEVTLQVMTGQHAVQTTTPLPRSYRQIESLGAQLVQRHAYAIEQPGRLLLQRQVIVPIGLDHPLRLQRILDLRIEHRNGVRQSQTDD